MNTETSLSAMAPYSWLAPQWQQLVQAMQKQMLPHAWLFSGTAGLGKLQLAQQFAQTLLCHQKTACGSCSSCHLFNSGAHPDFTTLSIPDDKKSIPIDAVRQVIRKLTLTKSSSSWSVAIIEPAEAMNRNAANALLKTLEEPTPNTLIILVSSESANLLPTIRSRCVQLRFTPPQKDLAKQWLVTKNPELAEQAHIALQYAGGAPLKAAEYADNDFLTRRSRFIQGLHQLMDGQTHTVALADSIKAEPVADVHNWLSHWIMDLLQLKMQSQSELNNADFAMNLKALAEKISMEKLLSFEQHTATMSKYVHSNAQPQLMYENLLTPLSF